MTGNNKTKVFHFLWDGGIGGTQRIVKNAFLDHAHSPLDHVAVIAHRHGTLITEDTSSFCLGMRNGYDFNRFMKIFGILSAHDNPVINIHVDTPLARLLLPSRFATVFTEHGDVLSRSPLNVVRRWLLSRSYGRVDRIICNSEYLKSVIERSYPPSKGKITVLHNPLLGASDRYRTLPSGMITLGFLGRFSREKGALDFVECASLLRRKNPRIQFKMIGGGPQFNRCKSRAAKHGLPMRFTGAIQNVEEELRACDLLAVPSHKEAFNMAVIEAKAMGIPIAAYPTGGLCEIIDDGINGIFAKDCSPIALFDTIETLINDCRLYRKLSENGITQVSNGFALEDYRNKWYSIIESLVQSQ